MGCTASLSSIYILLFLYRILFWSDSNSDASKIERAKMDGSGRSLVVTNLATKLYGLALDYDLERLYWCSTTTENESFLEYVNFDGRLV